MLSEKMLNLGKKRSVIREIFEYGKKRAGEIGAENIFDFSIGNPNVPAPEYLKNVLLTLLKESDPTQLHSYTSAQGDLEVRKKIADNINEKFSTSLSPENIYMTSGAAAALTISIKAMTLPDDEFIIFAPYFPEYTVFVETAGAKAVIIPPDIKNFQIDLHKFEEAINERTKGIIINSPNNPSGAIYSKETILSLCEILSKKERAYGHPIYIISDEPYRELIYDDIEVPYIINHYKNSMVSYSYSKSLSIPGERIGYISVSPEMVNSEDMYAAVCGAGRALGYVCAPSLFQKAIAECVNKTSDISVYKENRDILYKELSELGYSCVKPDGAFYLFIKALEDDAEAFCMRARKHELLLVAGDGFGCPGYVRISYCVRTDQIKKSIPAFAKLALEYKK